MQEPFKSRIAEIERTLFILAKKLDELTSKHGGHIIREFENWTEESPKNIQRMIEEAIHYLTGLNTELDQLLNLEEETHRN